VALVMYGLSICCSIAASILGGRDTLLHLGSLLLALLVGVIAYHIRLRNRRMSLEWIVHGAALALNASAIIGTAHILAVIGLAIVVLTDYVLNPFRGGILRVEQTHHPSSR